MNGAVSHLPRVQEASFSSKAEEGEAEGSRDKKAKRERVRSRKRKRGGFRGKEERRRVVISLSMLSKTPGRCC